jgi:hypothetical protein
MTENNDPLSKYYRQPSIYITLPSKGKYYSNQVLETTTTGELPVLPMTAKDELAFKTPDALMGGQATVDVIKSCIPNIKDPWQLVNFDVDTVLLAIRIASYGETMDITYSVPITNERPTTTVNLPALLDSVKNVEVLDEFVTPQGLKVKVAPLTYRAMTRTQIAQYEQQKIYATVNASKMSEEDKSKQFATSFAKVNEINFSLLVDSIIQITTSDDQAVTDKQQIKNFVNNCEAKIVNEVQDKLVEIRQQAQIKPLKIKATVEQIKQGVPATFDVPITFDNSNFFG